MNKQLKIKLMQDSIRLQARGFIHEDCFVDVVWDKGFFKDKPLFLISYYGETHRPEFPFGRKAKSFKDLQLLIEGYKCASEHQEVIAREAEFLQKLKEQTENEREITLHISAVIERDIKVKVDIRDSDCINKAVDKQKKKIEKDFNGEYKVGCYSVLVVGESHK